MRSARVRASRVPVARAVSPSVARSGAKKNRSRIAPARGASRDGRRAVSEIGALFVEPAQRGDARTVVVHIRDDSGLLVFGRRPDDGPFPRHDQLFPSLERDAGGGLVTREPRFVAPLAALEKCSGAAPFGVDHRARPITAGFGRCLNAIKKVMRARRRSSGESSSGPGAEVAKYASQAVSCFESANQGSCPLLAPATRNSLNATVDQIGIERA